MVQRWRTPIPLAAYAVLVGWIGWRTCPNKTEVGHMGATVYSWHTLRFDVFRVNPPLTRMIGGGPVAMCHPNYDWDDYSSGPEDRPEWALGRSFIAANTPEKIRRCFALARWSLIPLLLLGGYFGYRLSRDVYGDSAGVVFLALWCFSPLLLAWGATICPDAVAAALGLVAICALRGWLHRPVWPQACTAGVCLGVLPLAKLTWIIAFGLWPLIWSFWTVPIWLTKSGGRSLPLPPFRQLAAMLILGLYTLNMGYFFDGTCRPLGQYVFISRLFRGPEAPGNPQTRIVENRFAGSWLGSIPVPLPADFVQGIDVQRHDFERGLPSYLRGQWTDHGWWYYYLYALAVKMPLGTLCLAMLAVGVTIVDVARSKPSSFPVPLPQAGEGRFLSASWRDEMVVLAPGLAILIFVSSQTGFSVHSRYVIPALPFLFVWISKAARVFEMRPFTRRRLAIAAMAVAAIAWSTASTLWAYPHSLSYFNELVGGPRCGGEHLLDSNIDWGQDLSYLKRWLDEHPEVKLDGLAYFGSYPATLAGIPETPLPVPGPDAAAFNVNQPIDDDVGPRPGWYGLSVNCLYDRRGQYRYFLRFEPTAMAGYSIHIYHVTLEEANRVRRELGLPELMQEER